MKKYTFLVLILFGLAASEINAQCLDNKDAGTNPSDLEYLDEAYNKPSPYTFAHMLGVNDAGQFQSLQDEVNPITYMTGNLRAFHAMDYDFHPGLVYGTPYVDLVKPKETNGVPHPDAITRIKSTYEWFKGPQQILNISAAPEILNRTPLTWKEKVWQESDWYDQNAGLSIPNGIEMSFQNYTEAFIDQFAPAGGDVLINSYEVGNELWDYPFEEDYHAMLIGAHNAFVKKYGTDPEDWQMKLLPGSFQAWTRDNICTQSADRDFSNCGSSVTMFNQMGDYLNLDNCEVLENLYAINTHAYAFEEGTLDYVHPEKEHNEFLTFKSTVAFRDANPILEGKGVWLTETGYDSYDMDNGSGRAVGVGELTQAAYILRSFLKTSRYHLERVNFYTGYDLNTTDNMYHGDLYASTGFWKLAPDYSGKPSNGAVPKPSFYAMRDFQNHFGEKRFYASVIENENIHAYILAEEDGSDPYLVFWNPSASDDDNVMTERIITEEIVLPKGLTTNTQMARVFASTGSLTGTFDPESGAQFQAVANFNSSELNIQRIKRMPSYLPLVQSEPLDNEPPSAPINLIAFDTTLNSVRLSWEASTDNVGVDSYTVFKDGEILMDVSETSAFVEGLMEGTNYQFYVKAKDAAGNYSEESNVVNVTTLLMTAIDVSDSENEKLFLFPNPTKNILQFNMEGEVEIFDLFGKKVKDQKSGIKKISVGELSLGSYLFVLTDKKGKRFIGKFIKAL